MSLRGSVAARRQLRRQLPRVPQRPTQENDAARATSLAELPRFWHDVRGRVGSFLQTKVSTLGVLVFLYKHRLLPWACWQFCTNIHFYLGRAGNFAQTSVL